MVFLTRQGFKLSFNVVFCFPVFGFLDSFPCFCFCMYLTLTLSQARAPAVRAGKSIRLEEFVTHRKNRSSIRKCVAHELNF